MSIHAEILYDNNQGSFINNIVYNGRKIDPNRWAMYRFDESQSFNHWPYMRFFSELEKEGLNQQNAKSISEIASNFIMSITVTYKAKWYYDLTAEYLVEDMCQLCNYRINTYYVIYM